ncbi:MAG TPA: ABC transporter substrate-binding protein [Mycobacteriales bacterium]
MRRSPRRWRSGALRGVAALAVTALLASCGGGGGGSATKDGMTTAKIGVLPIVEVAPIYLGIQKGFYSDEKIDLRPQQAQGGAAIVPAVVSGQYEFGFSNVVSLMLARTKGLPLTMISSSSESTGQVGHDLSAVVVGKNSLIRTAKDLEGKTVSVNTLQNIGDVTVQAAMEAHGADGSKVKFVEMGFPDMQAALEQGRVDAAWVVEPFVSAALASGARAVLWNYAETDPKLIIAGYFTSEKLRKENPGLVDRFLRATQRSMAYAQSHPDEVKQVLTTYTKITADQTKAIVLPRYDPALDLTVLGHVATLVQKYGLTDTTPDTSALIGR